MHKTLLTVGIMFAAITATTPVRAWSLSDLFSNPQPEVQQVVHQKKVVKKRTKKTTKQVKLLLR